MRILEQDRETYREIWGVESYAALSPGELLVPVFRDMAQPRPGAMILDAGCGSGKGALALEAAGFAVRLCDLTDAGLLPEAAHLPFAEACLWHDLRPALGGPFVHYAYCCDVLEHIPTALTMLVVHQLLAVCTSGVFLSISFEEDILGAWVGQVLHRTTQNFVWWRDHLDAVAEIVEARDLLNMGTFLIRRR